MEMEFPKLLKVFPKPVEELFSCLCLGVIAIAWFLVSSDHGPVWFTFTIYHVKDLANQKLEKNIVMDLASQI